MTHQHATAADGAAKPRKRWITPDIAVLAAEDARNSANPLTTDAILSHGS